jgi:TP901 family phage tail tape measure protein
VADSILPPVVVSLVADIKQFSAKMDEAKLKMDEVEAKSAEGGAGGLLGSLSGAGMLGVAGAAAAAAAGVAVIGASALDSASKFQSAMTQVQNSAGLSTNATKNLGNAFVDTMGKSEFSATQIAQAYSQVAGQLKLLNGAQLTTKQSMDFVNAATDLATAKHLDLAAAMTATTSTMKAFQIPVAQAAQVTNDLFVTSGMTGTSIDGLANQFTKMHAKLGDAIPSLQDMDNLMVDMTAHGVGQGRALLTVTQAMTKLLDPSTKNVQLLQSMGVNAFNAQGKFVGMQQVLQELQPAFAGMNEQQKINTAQTLFGAGAASSMLTLIQAGPAAYQAAASAIQNHTNVSSAAANASKNFENQMKILGAAVSDLQIQLGNVLLPVATRVVGWLSTTGVKDVKDFINGFDGRKVNSFAGDLGQLAKTVDILGQKFANAVGHIHSFFKELGFSKGLLSDWGSLWNDVKSNFDVITSGGQRKPSGIGSSGLLGGSKLFAPGPLGGGVSKVDPSGGAIKGDVNVTNNKLMSDITGPALGGITTTANAASNHLPGIQGIRMATAATQANTNHLPSIEAALRNPSKVTITARFT